jgi:hypothetical protein
MRGRRRLILAGRRAAIRQPSREGLTPGPIAAAINRAEPGAGMTARRVAAYIGRLRQAGEAVPVRLDPEL